MLEGLSAPARRWRHFCKTLIGYLAIEVILIKPLDDAVQFGYALALMFEISPRLADAYRLMNEFLKAIHSESSEVGRPRLKEWLLAAESLNMEEFKDCVRAYRN